MAQRAPIRLVRFAAAVQLALTFVIAAFPLSARAGGDDDRRAQAGVRVFRSLLSADLEIEKKSADGKLLLLFVHGGNAKRANELAQAVSAGTDGQAATIKGLPIATATTADASLRTYGAHAPAGIFFTDPPDAKTLRAIVQYGVANHIIVYSPFEGDVERGAHGGLAIEAQVRPYINAATLSASHIELKSFFMKVTKVYQ